MANLSEKLVLIAIGAAAGAVGYMAVKHPEELKNIVNNVCQAGKNIVEKKINEVAEDLTQSQDT